MTGMKRFHPASAMIYFAAVIALAMVGLNPIGSAMFFVFGGVLYALLCGRSAFLKSLRWSLPLMAVIALTNPLFVHRGATALFFITGSPITLEALAYGGVSATMIGGVYYWFACLGSVMTDDKIVCIFGRRFPHIALVLSMTLGFVPRLGRMAGDINDAQISLGMYDGGSYSSRIRAKLSVFSVLVSQSLEGSIDTADTMLARGYALPGRSSFSRYRFGAGDAAFCVITAVLTVAAVTSMICGGGAFEFYPTLTDISFGVADIVFYISVFGLLFISILFETGEKLLWRCLK